MYKSQCQQTKIATSKRLDKDWTRDLVPSLFYWYFIIILQKPIKFLWKVKSPLYVVEIIRLIWRFLVRSKQLTSTQTYKPSQNYKDSTKKTKSLENQTKEPGNRKRLQTIIRMAVVASNKTSSNVIPNISVIKVIIYCMSQKSSVKVQVS